MADTREIKVLISDSQIQRAAKIAEAMTADPDATGQGDAPWDAQDVLNAAITRGLDALEQAYRP
jgi:2-phospho-L-lactate guanylyltransferase (CobY/MobA/RfbA family)